MPKQRHVDDDVLNALALTSPSAQRIVDEFRARQKRRGRPAADEADYRRLELWWKRFRRLNSNLTKEQALKKFSRVRGEKIEKLLYLKRGTPGSLRKAISRGAKETAQVRKRRIAGWRIIPGGLWHAVHGRQRVLVTNPQLAEYIVTAQKVAYEAAGHVFGGMITVTSKKNGKP